MTQPDKLPISQAAREGALAVYTALVATPTPSEASYYLDGTYDLTSEVQAFQRAMTQAAADERWPLDAKITRLLNLMEDVAHCLPSHGEGCEGDTCCTCGLGLSFIAFRAAIRERTT